MILRARSVAAALLAASMALPAGSAFAQPAYNSQAPAYGQPGYDNNAPPPGATMERPKPKGGCLKYGAAGAVGGHFAHHHGVLGAMGGCAVGAYVKHRSKRSIRETGQP